MGWPKVGAQIKAHVKVIRYRRCLRRFRINSRQTQSILLVVLDLDPRVQPSGGYNAVPHPITGNFMPPKPDLVFYNAPIALKTDHSAFTVQLSPAKPTEDLSHTNRPYAPIIKEWVSDSEDDYETTAPQIAHSSVQSTKQVTPPRHSVQQAEAPIPAITPKPTCPKTSCSVRKRIGKLVLPICANVPKIMMTIPRHAHSLNTRSNLTIRRHKTNSHSLNTSNSSLKVTATKALVVSAAKVEETANFALMAIPSSSSFDNEDNIIVLTNEVEARDNYIITLKQKLSQAETKRDDLKLKFEKFQASSKSLTELLANQTDGKHGLGYSSLENDYESVSPSCPSDRVQLSGGYNVVPPLIIGNIMPPKPDLVFHTAPIAVETDHLAFTVQLSLAKPAEDLSYTNRPSAPIIEEWVSDSEDDSKTTAPQITHSSVQSTKQVTPPRHSVQPIEALIPAAKPKPTSPNTSSSVLSKSKPVFVDIVRPICVDVPKIMMTRPRHAHSLNTRSNSTIRRHKTCSHLSNTSNSSIKVTATKSPLVSAPKGMKGKWVRRPKCPILDHDLRTTGASMTLKRLYYIDAQGRSKVQPSGGYNVVPPLTTVNFMPPKPGLVFHTALIAVETDHLAFTIQLSLVKPAEDLSYTNRPSAPITEECVSDSEDDSETTASQIAHSSVQSTKQVTPPRHYVQLVEAPILAVTPKPTCPKTSCSEEEPAYFALMAIPSSSSFDNELSLAKPAEDLSHTNRPSAPIIEEWVFDYEDDSKTTALQIVHSFVQSTKQVTPPRHYVQPIEAPILTTTPKPTSPKTSSSVPAAMLPKSKPVSITDVRPICADVPKIMMTRPGHAHSLNTRSNSTIRRHKTYSQSSNTSNSSPKVTAAKALMVSAAKGKKGKWVWRPKCPILDNDSRTTESPTSSPRHSPPTSPQYSPFNFSWEPSPRWTPETTSGSTPGLLWEIHNDDDGFHGLLHEYWAVGNTMEVDHAEEELIPVDRLVATSSIVDGATPQGVEVINNANNGDNTNGINNELNEVRFDGCSCSICYEACTSRGKHQICCLPCGHCPQCKRSCTLEDVRILYVTSQPTDDHETSLKRDDALEKLPTELEQCVHALEECVHAIEASLQRVSIGTCPQCKRSCTLEDVRILYVTSQPIDDHETSLKDDALENLPAELEQCVHALEKCVHAIEASLQRVSIGT
nr:hypothetical protein [Tanacetum cinerariifolium]